uniref:Uncharacterized protein n=1 Tax=Anguilla anguilla TaxID=7936 RepID=A0A0E9TU84_ANGAN
MSLTENGVEVTGLGSIIPSFSVTLRKLPQLMSSYATCTQLKE